MALPTCECVNGLPVQQQLGFIYCALLEIAAGESGPTLQQMLDLGALVIGEIRDYAGDANHNAPPPGWLYTDGQAINRTTFAALFTVIGTTYGAGNGTTTFNLPDLQGRVTAGFQDNQDRLEIEVTNPGGFPSSALGDAGGIASANITTGELPGYLLNAGTDITDAGGGGNFATDSAPTGTPSDPLSRIQPTMLMNKIIFTGVYP